MAASDAVFASDRGEGPGAVTELARCSFGRQCEDHGRAGEGFLVFVFNPDDRIAPGMLVNIVNDALAFDDYDVEGRGGGPGILTVQALNRKGKRSCERNRR